MKSQRRYLVAAIISFTLLSTSVFAQGKEALTLGTSTVGGTYFIYGGVVANLLNNS
jgi:TRAP-type uncharacterized transport system substrate-binding protein